MTEPLPAQRWREHWAGAAADLEQTLGPDLARLARGRGFTLSSAQLAAAGVPRHLVRRRVRDGAWQTLRRGFVSPLPAPVDADEFVTARRRHALECAAAAATNPHHVGCGRSAAVLHGLPTMRLPAAPQLSVIPTRGTGRLRTREAALHVDDLSFWWGIPVTGVARTVLDLARHDRWDGVMAGDAALREGLTDPRLLTVTAARMSRWPGIVRARELLALLDGASESPLESLVRLRLHDEGFPAPVSQAVIGRFRVDFLWPRQRVILEVDGRGKYDHAELRRERRREAELRMLGYRIERVMWRDATRDWPLTCRVLRAALATSPT